MLSREAKKGVLVKSIKNPVVKSYKIVRAGKKDCDLVVNKSTRPILKGIVYKNVDYYILETIE
jgi:hypothetical protein